MRIPVFLLPAITAVHLTTAKPHKKSKDMLDEIDSTYLWLQQKTCGFRPQSLKLPNDIAVRSVIVRCDNVKKELAKGMIQECFLCRKYLKRLGLSTKDITCLSNHLRKIILK